MGGIAARVYFRRNRSLTERKTNTRLLGVIPFPFPESVHVVRIQCDSSSAASLSTRSSITSLWCTSCPPPPSCCNAAPVLTGTSGPLRGSNPGAILRSASRFLRCFSSSRARRCASWRSACAAIDVRRLDSMLSM